jgi:5-methyltetrahydropteroyltriglutamate--homocysteine methyltransferase
MHPLKTLRTDQVGSLLRPNALKEVFLKYGRGEVSRETLTEAEDLAIRNVVALQEQAGLEEITDGEFRRLNWQVSFSIVDGWNLWDGSWKTFLENPDMIGEGERAGTRGKDAVESFKIPASSRLALRENFPLQEFAFLKTLTRRPTKAMLMGPDRVSQMCDIAGSAPHYADAEEFLADLVAIQHRMVGDLLNAGCPYIQLDEPSYTGYVDRDTLERIAARGEDPMANLSRAIDASNAVIDGFQGLATFGIHICRGNRSSMWHREGTYDGIAEHLFSRLKFDRLLLEYDTERAGGFEPLRFVPRGKDGPVVVLGLITTKTGRVESQDELLDRIEEAEQFIPVEQLAISPQCGFASGLAGNQLSEGEQWRKLEVMLKVAERVWT